MWWEGEHPADMTPPTRSCLAFMCAKDERVRSQISYISTYICHKHPRSVREAARQVVFRLIFLSVDGWLRFSRLRLWWRLRCVSVSLNSVYRHRYFNCWLRWWLLVLKNSWDHRTLRFWYFLLLFWRVLETKRKCHQFSNLSKCYQKCTIKAQSFVTLSSSSLRPTLGTAALGFWNWSSCMIGFCVFRRRLQTQEMRASIPFSF